VFKKWGWHEAKYAHYHEVSQQQIFIYHTYKGSGNNVNDHTNSMYHIVHFYNLSKSISESMVIKRYGMCSVCILYIFAEVIYFWNQKKVTHYHIIPRIKLQNGIRRPLNKWAESLPEVKELVVLHLHTTLQ